MTTEREVSHLQACSSHDIDCPISKSSSNQSPPKCRSSRRASNIQYVLQRNLNEVSLLDLLRLARRLKYPTLTTLRLFVSLEDQPRVALHFGAADQRTTDALFAFTRALARAVEGWMQTLELGVCLGLRDINTMCPAIRSSRTLRHLSFANSRLGDDILQVLASSLQHCQPLQILNLSGCALTDVSAAVITAVVKGEISSSRPQSQNLKKKLLAEHRSPKYGQQWRQNVILVGKWSPAPDPVDSNAITSRTEMSWETTLRKPTIVGSNRHEVVGKSTKATNFGLVALDLSCNSFTDALSEELCPLLYKKPPLRALNLRCNQMTRSGAKPLLDVMKDLSILRLVDMRGNTDETLLGILENGEHYTTFSTFQSPFWMDPESLDPIICSSIKCQSNTSANRLMFTSSPQSNMPEKQPNAPSTSHHSCTLRGGGAARILSPRNTISRVRNAGRNDSPVKSNKVTPKSNINTISSRANISLSCSGASVSNVQDEHRGVHCRLTRHGHCSHHVSPSPHQENEDTSDYYEHKRFISAPVKQRPAANSARISPARSLCPERTTFVDQNSYRPSTSAHINPCDQDLDRRFTSPRTLDLPREYPIWHDRPDENYIRGRDILHRYPSGGKRAQSGSYNVRSFNSLGDYNNQAFNRDYEHHNSYRKLSTSQPPSRRWFAPIYNTRSESQGRRSPDKSSPIRCHHRCKLLNDRQEQRNIRPRVAKGAVEDHGQSLHLYPSLTKPAPLSNDKKELVEWNNFVNQMTMTLLNLKDGLDHLIGSAEGAVAHEAATKFHQMPSSFFRSGMLRLLGRSCKVLNSHLTSLTNRHKVSKRHINAENQAPMGNGETRAKETCSKIGVDQESVGKQEKGQKPLQNVTQSGLYNSKQQHPLAGPPLTTLKGTNIPQIAS
ncbi:uncharacterized protein [Physcomitrium patens]